MAEARVLRALAIGASAGLRTFTAPAVLSHAASRGGLPELRETGFSPLASPGFANGLAVAALGEIVGDKTPLIPSRTDGASAVGRVVSGAVSGAALHAATGRNAVAGAALAGAGALAAAYAGEWYRGLGAEAGIPDPILAILEDAAAMGLALLAVRDT